MIKFNNGGALIESKSELPDVWFENLYLDFETSSGHPQKDSLNPWSKETCSIIGAAVTGDQFPGAIFIPRDVLLSAPEWWLRLLRKSQRWINPNIKYDCHVMQNAEPEIASVYDKEVVDVTMLAKIIDSDRTYKGGYGLDALAMEFLDEDILKYYKRMEPYLYKNGQSFNKDWGRIPLDILAEYACQDVITGRDVYHFEVESMPDQSRELMAMEIRVTRMLLNMERRGLKVNLQKVMEKELVSKYLMLKIAERLKILLGEEINPRSPDDVHDVLVNRFGLPVLSWTNEEDDEKESNPSFDKDAMVMYSQHYEVRANPLVKEVVALITTYRREATHNSLFWEPWPKLATREGMDDVLHSDYNQTVRSGRMSCKQPNAQQLDLEAKECIEPREGYCFISMDESQIEYRLIVHYTENPAAVKAYCDDPLTDYHKWVGDSVGVTRRTGKTINLALGFGMGKKKTVANLEACEDLSVDNPTQFEIRRRATSVYDTFHRNMPELKRTSQRAAITAAKRGFVFNAHGRRLHLPRERAHIAFNRIVQSEAADLFKEVAVGISDAIEGHDCYLNALVHDEALVEVPIGEESVWAPRLCAIMETPKVEYKVPIRTSRSMSTKTWGACK